MNFKTAGDVRPAASARSKTTRFLARCSSNLLVTTLLTPVLMLNPFGTAISSADDNVISTIVNVQNGSFPLDGTDSLTITSTGEISTSANTDNAVSATGNGNTITNLGVLSTGGVLSHGIYLDNSDNNTITNLGALSTSGFIGQGIYLSNSDNNSVIQSGNISIQGSSGGGITFEFSNNNSLIHSGTIFASEANGSGISVGDSDNNSIIHSGTISTTGTSGIGMFILQSDNNSFVQSGTTLTTGEDAVGNYLFNSNNNNFNQSGTISTTGVDAHAIFLTGSSNNVFTITGKLTSTQANAFLFDTFATTGNIINLTTGAFLGGAIDLNTSGNFVNITTTPGHSVVWDFGAGSTITSGIQVSGTGAYLVNGNTFYSVDPTGFLARADSIGDTAGMLTGVANSRLGSGAPAVFEQPSGFAYTRDNGSEYSDARFWGDFIASTSQYGATSTTLGYNSQQYGVALGYERDFDIDTTFGLMGGYLYSGLKADSRFTTSQEIKSRGGYLGIYGSHELANEIKLSGSLMAGRSANDSSRIFNNNTVTPSFTEMATATYGSTFIAPSISISKDYVLDEKTILTPMFSALYAHQWSSDYAETGSSSNLTVGSSEESVFEAEAALGLTRHLEETDQYSGGKVTARLGALVRTTPSSNMPALSLAGVGALTNASRNDNPLIAVTGGLDFDLQLTSSVSFTASGDVAIGNNDYVSAQGKLGFRVRF